jgi:tripartite-type tricarboxylate transporter receptor subunit TctC
MLSRRSLLGGSAAAAVTPLLPSASSARTFPSRLVRIYNGFAAGGPTDIVSRICGGHLSKLTGQTFISETKTGANGFIAGREVVNAPPDGHTLLLSPQGPVVMAYAMNPKLAYNPATALTPVTMVVRFPQIMEVSTRLPVRTYDEFVKYARENSGKLRHGSPGIGGAMHLASELLQERIGFKSQHIPYRGTAPYTIGMIQNEIDWGIDVPAGATPLMERGVVRLLAVTTEQRSPIYPDVPSLTELGLNDAAWPNFFALFVVKGTPQDIVDQLAEDFASVWKVPENVARLKPLGLEVWSLPPKETASFLDKDRARWTALIEKLNLGER